LSSITLKRPLKALRLYSFFPALKNHPFIIYYHLECGMYFAILPNSKILLEFRG